MLVEDAAGGLEPVDHGHPDVHEDHVGLASRASASACSPFVGLADDLEVVGGLEEHAEARAHERLVVDDEHARRHRTLLVSGQHGTAPGSRAHRPAGRPRTAPPSASTRSRMPRMPWPSPFGSAVGAEAVVEHLDVQTVAA